jgi:hypothetical protein
MTKKIVPLNIKLGYEDEDKIPIGVLNDITRTREGKYISAPCGLVKITPIIKHDARYKKNPKR